jgi:hypothetical protein
MITADAATTRCIVFPGDGQAIGAGRPGAVARQGFGKEMGEAPKI